VIKIVYFDRNVINRIKAQLFVGDSDYLLLRNAVYEGRFIAPISVPLLEETLPILKTQSKLKRVTEQQIMTELFNWKWLVKPHAPLLDDDIKSYANGQPFSFPFLSLNLTPQEFFNPTGQMSKDFLKIIDETRLLKEKQFLDVKDAKRIYQERFKMPAPSFDEFWKRVAELTTEHIADRGGLLQECKQRGLDGLLNVKSARLYVTYYVAYFYYSFVLGERVLPSDSRDHHHAVSASVADIFVTHDKRFARMLKLVPIDGFEVINLNTLLQRLRHPNLFGFEAHEAN
jgi:hypothetical protein